MFLFAFLISLIAGLSTVIGALVIFFKFKEKNVNKFIAFSLSLSLSIMIGISITELIPESFFSILKNTQIIKGLILVFIVSGVGYILITIITNLINKSKSKNDLFKLGILSMIVLMIHNLPEGIATFMSTYKDIDLGLKLGAAIMFHNIPEGIAIAVPIYYSTKSKIKAFKYTFISGLAEPLGATLTYLFLKNYITIDLINIILLLVGSIMITLSIKELFPKALEYQENKAVKTGLIFGAVLMIVNIILHL